MFGASEEMRVEHLQNNGINGAQFAGSVLCQPAEIIIRPWFGTRYNPVPVTFLSMAMMLLLPAVMSLIGNFMQMIPLLQVPHQVGMFSLGDFARLYFLVSVFHAVRLWRRMIDPSRELHSEYEGPALPFFGWLPKGDSFWFVRIVMEPAFLLLVAIVLQDLFIAQPSLALYLKLAALGLFIRNFTSWFQSWEWIRRLLDARNSAPVIAKLVKNEATQEDLAPMHLASFPKNIDPDIRQAAAVQIARIYSPENINF
jgi:hypothetical protein